MSTDWVPAPPPSGEYTDIRYELSTGEDTGIAKITINRPEVHNAFRPETIVEISGALEHAREDPDVGVIILTGAGDRAFCSGGDQRVRGDRGGYVQGADPARAGRQAAVGRFHVTDLHVQMRRCPKPIVAMVAGWAIGGGHILHIVCDLTVAADNARFGQVGPGSAPSTVVSAPPSWPGSSAPRRPRRSGSCAASTTRPRRSTWAWSTPWFRSTSSSPRRFAGVARCSPCRRSRCG